MKFSIIIPAFNAECFIQETLNSVFEQTISDFEVIVVNDGSTDSTLDILQTIKDPRLRIVDQKNSGPSHARNYGCSIAQGDYLAFLDADDYWYPNHLECANQFFTEHPTIEWYGSRSFKIQRHCEKPQERGIPCFKVKNYLENGQAFINCTSLIMRKSLFVAAGGFIPGLTNLEDLIFLANVARISPFVGVNTQRTAIYYITPGSLSKQKNRATLKQTYETLLTSLKEGVIAHQVKVPHYPHQKLIGLLKLTVLHEPEADLITRIQPFSSFCTPFEWRLWHRFIRHLYRTVSTYDITGMDIAFIWLIFAQARPHLVSILKTKGVRAALLWSRIYLQCTLFKRAIKFIWFLRLYHAT